MLAKLELLFEKGLQINPLDLVKRLAHSKRVVAVWPGELRGDRLIYADMSHPEHRDYTRRMTNMVIQSQASWGAVERVEKGKRVIRLAPTTIDHDELTAWLIEAAVRYTGKPVSVPTLQSLPALFPFTLTRPLAYVISNSPNLDLRSEGPSNQFVALRSTV